jgi:hypothetical protein
VRSSDSLDAVDVQSERDSRSGLLLAARDIFKFAAEIEAPLPAKTPAPIEMAEPPSRARRDKTAFWIPDSGILGSALTSFRDRVADMTRVKEDKSSRRRDVGGPRLDRLAA